jgi:hypothetical protein
MSSEQVEAPQTERKLTNEQRTALALLQDMRRRYPEESWDGATCSEATWPHLGQTWPAFINWRTARSLQRLGFVTTEYVGPDEGSTITLTDAGAEALSSERVKVEARPQRIQRKRTKGWRMPDDAVYVGRPTAWGNPWVLGDLVTVDGIGSDGQMVCSTIMLTPAMAVECYRDLMVGRLSYEFTEHPTDRAYVDGWHEALGLLAGGDLACWCPLDQPCHADVLLELANHA